MAGDILRCPRCKPPVVRRIDGRRITGWLPVADYVGYLIPARPCRKSIRLPRACPNCGGPLTKEG